MGKFINESLTKDEKVIAETNMHWSIYLNWIIISIITFGFGLPLLLIPFLAKRSTEIAVTNKRVIGKTGIFSTTSVDMRIDKVESIIVRQGILGSMLGYGTIAIVGSGGTSETFPCIANPKEFKKLFVEFQNQ